MNTPSRSVRWYRRLLWLYPKHFRNEYGDDMVIVFEEMLRDLPRGRVWLRTLRDATSSIVTQRLETAMSKPSMLPPLAFAALAVTVLVAMSTLGVNNLAVFFLTLVVTAGAVLGALVYWQANRAYVEPSDELHRHWLRVLAAGVGLIAVINAGAAADISGPWLPLFASFIFGMVLVVLGVVLGAWHGVARLRAR
jgi:hypothetical protein